MLNAIKNKNTLLWLVGLGILFPLFFQLGGGIYNDIHPTTDSQGVISTLPLPISILTCLFGLAFFLRRLTDARVALLMIGATIAVSIISLFLGADDSIPLLRKSIVIVQVVLPLVGLLLGVIVNEQEDVIARAFLTVITIIVPLQLIATWLQGGLLLTQYLYWFSIYSHFQYVTLIFVCAYAYSLTSLWQSHKTWLCLVALPVFFYVLSGLSFLTMFAFASLSIAFSIQVLWRYRANFKLIAISVILFIGIGLGGLTYFGKMFEQERAARGESGMFVGKFKSVAEGNIPVNLQERFGDWRMFLNGVAESPKTIWFGHPQPMPREVRTSPHNWYIDIAYTFGIIALLPVAALIAYTGWLLFKRRKVLSGQTWWLAIIVFYLVIIDSNFKVTLRQPYPGIFAYFMWGLLLTRLGYNLTPKSKP